MMGRYLTAFLKGGDAAVWPLWRAYQNGCSLQQIGTSEPYLLRARSFDKRPHGSGAGALTDQKSSVRLHQHYRIQYALLKSTCSPFYFVDITLAICAYFPSWLAPTPQRHRH